MPGQAGLMSNCGVKGRSTWVSRKSDETGMVNGMNVVDGAVHFIELLQICHFLDTQPPHPTTKKEKGSNTVLENRFRVLAP